MNFFLPKTNHFQMHKKCSFNFTLIFTSKKERIEFGNWQIQKSDRINSDCLTLTAHLGLSQKLFCKPKMFASVSPRLV